MGEAAVRAAAVREVLATEAEVMVVVATAAAARGPARAAARVARPRGKRLGLWKRRATSAAARARAWIQLRGQRRLWRGYRRRPSCLRSVTY